MEANVFTKLRRTEINVTYDKTGYSDEELVAVSKSKPDTLTVEELLFTATLTNDLNEKLRLYEIATKNYATDYRTFNNLGAVLYMQNKMDEAKTAFEKANTIQDNPISKNNLGAIAGSKGDREGAKKLLSEAKGGISFLKFTERCLMAS